MPPVLDRLLSERARLIESCDEIAAAAQEGERDLSDAELELITRQHSRIDTELDPQIDRLSQIDEIRERHVQRAQQIPEPGRVVETSAPAGDDQPVYRSFAQYARDEIVRRFDGIAQLAGGPPARAQAVERLDRAVANTTTTEIAGLLPTSYLTQIMQVIDTSRPVVDSSRRVALSSGKLSYPMITQKPVVGKQTAEKTEAPSQAVTVVFQDVIADTYVGAGDLSWQAINWSTPDALVLWFDLAAEQYALQTEAAAGSVVAASGTAPVAVATDDLEGWTAAIAEAAGRVYSATRRRANTLYAGITTGYELVGLVSAASPVFLAGGQFSLGTGQGSVAGLQLVISPGLPATFAAVAYAGDLLCAETAGAPVELRAVEPAIGGMEVGIIGAFTAKLVEAAAVVPLTAP
jgi:HK97 family phage major capsid protein